MYRVKKIKIHLTKDQRQIVEKTFGTLRFIYNKFVEVNIDYHYETGQYFSAYEFEKFINHELALDYPWIKEVSTKAMTHVLKDAEQGFKRFFSKQNGFLRFKSKRDPVQSMYFIKTGIRFTKDLSHVWIPILHEIKLCEKGYILPVDIPYITSGRIVKENDTFYVAFKIECDYGFREEKEKPYSDGMGIDVGIKNYAIIYHEGKCMTIPHFNELPKVKWLESKIKYLQGIISYKEGVNLKKKGYKIGDKIKKGEAIEIYHTRAIEKLRKRVRRYQKKLHNIRIHLLYRICNTLVKTKPKYITVECLNVTDMLQNNSHKFADKIQKSLFFKFKEILLAKCEEYKITLREANQYFASSKTCSRCGEKKKRLSLLTRVFKCKHCSLKIDRDENAAINLYNLKSYKILAV